MMSCLEIDPEKDAPDWSVLVDNRDYKAVPSWDPTDRAVNDDVISESFLLDQKFLKFRSLTLRALATAVYMSEDIHPSRISASIVAKNNACKLNLTNNFNNASAQAISDSERASLLSPILETIIDDLIQHQKVVDQDRVDISVSNNSILGPDKSRLSVYMNNVHVDLLVTLLKLTLNVYKIVSTKDQTEQSGANQLLASLSKQATFIFKKMLTTVAEFVNTQGNRLFQRCEKLESIINVIESSSFAAILCGVCNVLLKSGNKFVNTPKHENQGSVQNSPANSGKVINISTNKGGKKKGAKTSSGTSVEIRRDLLDFTYIFNEVIDSFTTTIRSLLQLVEDFEKVVALDQLSIPVEKIKFSELTLGETGEDRGISQSEIQPDMSCLNHNTEDSSKMTDQHPTKSRDSVQLEKCDKDIPTKSNQEKVTKAATEMTASQRKKDISLLEEACPNLKENVQIQHLTKLLDSIQLDILKQMESSYGISFLQIKTVVQNKQNYFNFLKCDIGSNAQMNK